MAKNATIQARIDADTKSKAQMVLSALDITMTEAVSMFFKQVVYQRGIPFDVKIPNDVTTDVLMKSEAGEDLHEVSTVKELFEELNS